MPRFMRIAIALLGLISSMLAETSPTPTPTLTPQQRLAQEIATLRAVQQIAQFTRQNPPTDAEIDATRKIYTDLMGRYPAEADPYAAYGDYLHSVRKNEEAFQQWQSALKINPLRDDVLAAQADLLLETGQIVAAADALERAISIAPANAAYFYGLAHIYTLFRQDLIQSRHLTEAELITRGTAYFKQASELAPDNLVYAQAYAEAFYTQPQPDWSIARSTWESLLVRSEDKMFIHGHLVRVNIRLNDKAEALRHLAFLTGPAYAHMKNSLQKQIDKL